MNEQLLEKLIKKEITKVINHPFPQTEKPMSFKEKKEFEKEKQRKRQEFFANRNKKRQSKKSKNRVKRN